jgi:transposase
MDSDKDSGQIGRLEVVELGRRRRWSEDEKLKIVLESLQSPRQVSATARRYGVSRSLLLKWRRSFRPQQQAASGRQVGFMPARVIAEPEPATAASVPAGGGTIEIEFATGTRMRIAGAVDAATVSAAVAALSDGPRQR